MKQTLKVIQNTIEIGLSKPVKFLHMTDTHLTRDDPTGWRDGAFDLYPGGCEELFAQAVDYAVKNKLTPLIYHFVKRPLGNLGVVRSGGISFGQSGAHILEIGHIHPDISP